MLITIVIADDDSLSHNNNDSRTTKMTIGPILQQRLSLLQTVSSSAYKKILQLIPRSPNHACDPRNIVQITEKHYGGTCNQMVEFTHGLWIAYRCNRTLMMSEWMTNLLPFETNYLESMFCITGYSKLTRGLNILTVKSSDAFFVYQLANQPSFSTLFYISSTKKSPSSADISPRATEEISLFFIAIYAALWSHTKQYVLDASKWIIENHLQANFRYSSVHKRSFEGECNEDLFGAIQLSDINPNDIPMNHIEWNNDLSKNHPLCSMTASFLNSTMNLHHRPPETTKLYVAFDGDGDISDYKQSSNNVFLDVLSGYQASDRSTEHSTTNPHGHSTKADHDKLQMFIDMFVAMNSDLFVMNPRSTFSWQIFVIRACLSLQSVPVLAHQDLYTQTPAQFGHRQFWISWSSIYSALEALGK